MDGIKLARLRDRAFLVPATKESQHWLVLACSLNVRRTLFQAR